MSTPEVRLNGRQGEGRARVEEEAGSRISDGYRIR